MKNLLLLAACAAPLALTACGGDDPQAPAAVVKMTAAEANPSAPIASSTVGRIAVSPEAQTRLGLVDLTRDGALKTPLAAGELRRLVLGDAGAKRADAAAGEGAVVAAQDGDATLTDHADGQERIVVGGSEALRTQLANTRPNDNAGEDETSAAVQACLGNAVAQVITGPETLGDSSAVGVGIADGQDQPRGPQLRICVAPLRVKALHDAERQLKEDFPAGTGDPDRQPVIAEQEIGERHMLGAAVALESVSAAELRAWLRGGERIEALARYRPGNPGDTPVDPHG